MATVQISGLPELLAAVGDDWLEIEEAATGLSYRIKKANLIGAILTGGGTIDTGGHTITVPASGTAALKTGTPTEGNLASWADANTVQDTGVAAADVAQLAAATNAFTGRIAAAGFSSGNFTLSDDTATAITPPSPNGAMLTFYGTTGGSSRGEMALWAFRAVTGAVTNIVSGSNADVVNSTVLTGTTGADGKFTYSCSGGQVYVENRLGQTVNLQYLFLG